MLVATDPWLHRIVVASEVIAHASDDGVAQVKLTDLKAKTQYYYRFVYEKAGQYLGSAIGRAKTAPQPQDGSPVRFGLANCQDAIGRYYNTYFAALVQDLDFVVHVGDYIYETTGDPSFQGATGRGVVFTDTAGAIALEAPSGRTYYAAASVSNYRELYRFYRSDPLLQRMHERFTFVNIWDDHEYSDDCWGDTATYFDGLRNEKNTARRRNAEGSIKRRISSGAIPAVMVASLAARSSARAVPARSPWINARRSDSLIPGPSPATMLAIWIARRPAVWSASRPACCTDIFGA